MLKKIILFRHGEKQKIDSIVADDKRSVHLTDLGVTQINKLGQALAQNFPTLKSSSIIYSSPYIRAIQSAEIIQSILNIKEIISIPDFGEFYASNNYEIAKDIRQHLQTMAMQDPDWISPETNLSLNNVISSFESKLKEICQNTLSDLILISTHGGIIRNTVYSIDPKFRPSNETIADSKIHEGGFTILNFDGANFTVDQFDVFDHVLGI